MIAEERRKALLRGDLLLAILDWVLAEQMAGRRPNDVTVAQHFALTVEEATMIHDHLEEIGEL
jgi:hypothetical protein